MDRILGLRDPGVGLLMEDIIAQKGSPLLKFWMRFMQAFEDQHGREERIKTAMLFSPGIERDWYYEMDFSSDVGTAYTAMYGLTDHVSNDPWFYENYEPGIVATLPSNIVRSVNKLVLMVDKRYEDFTDAELRQLAVRMKQAIEIEQNFSQWAKTAFDAAMIGLTALALVSGVGAVVGAGTFALRAAALVVLAIEASDAVQTYTDFIGGDKDNGINPLEEAAAFLGRTLGDSDGEKAMRTAYSMINIAVGVKGKWRALAIIPAGVNYGDPGAMMQPADANEVEVWERR
ncbi:hypothetical protein FNJ84_21225 [Paracoccus sp. M683]|uniref:hypothetical protein n=1 Tax=Paracoccus sp. M683 TaxID=2594268 RepID=UPI00117D71A9|nr:hypothetical protein [Paracoccus sp. M683]TRW92129.1 hypothetical protein FNJ84_21225 [Paracoccus sp. M683]